MKSNEQPTQSAEEQKTSDRIEDLSQKDDKELLARIIVEQSITNSILERNRRNTSTLTTMAWVLLILYILAALLPSNTSIIEIIN